VDYNHKFAERCLSRRFFKKQTRRFMCRRSAWLQNQIHSTFMLWILLLRIGLFGIKQNPNAAGQCGDLRDICFQLFYAIERMPPLEL
jgi:hypothetical protein